MQGIRHRPAGGGEDFQVEIQASPDGAYYPWQSGYLHIDAYPGQYSQVNIRTRMSVASGQTQGWSFSLEPDAAQLGDFQSSGGYLWLGSVTTTGTGVESLNPSVNETAARSSTSYTQGILIDTSQQSTLAPTADFVTSRACYAFTVPYSEGYWMVRLKFTHDVGSPGIRTVMTQENQSNVPCARNLDLIFSVSESSSYYGSCNLSGLGSSSSTKSIFQLDEVQEVAGAGQQPAGGQTCQTIAELVPPFGDVGVFQSSLLADCNALLTNARGHALVGMTLFVAAEVRVTRINLPGDGIMPITETNVTELVGFPLEDSHEVVHDPLNNHLLATNRVFPDEAPDILRINLNSSPPSICTDILGASSNAHLVWAIDRFPPGTPALFGNPGDLCFSQSNVAVGTANPIKTYRPSAPPCSALPTFLNDWADDNFITKGVAIGNFNGAGAFGVYFVESPSAVRRVRDGGGFLTEDGELFADLAGVIPLPNLDALAFDPISGDLFVSEDASLARIFRIRSSGSVEPFGINFNRPNGFSFNSSGVMLVSEDQNIVVADGWRSMFRRGDISTDGLLDISDPIALLSFLFLGGQLLAVCDDSNDADDSGAVDITDAVFLLQHLFLGGPEPPPPGGPTAQCGRDPTPDLLGCISFPGCVIP